MMMQEPPSPLARILLFLRSTLQSKTGCAYRKLHPSERVERHLKSGCQIEEPRFHTVERIRKAIALYSPVAVRILALRELARREPDAPATHILSDLEWRTLHTYIHEKPPVPDAAPPSLREATLWVGRLGGHNGRKGDGMPGVKTLWRGWRDLELLVHYASLHS